MSMGIGFNSERLDDDDNVVSSHEDSLSIEPSSSALDLEQVISNYNYRAYEQRTRMSGEDYRRYRNFSTSADEKIENPATC